VIASLIISKTVQTGIAELYFVSIAITNRGMPLKDALSAILCCRISQLLLITK